MDINTAGPRVPLDVPLIVHMEFTNRCNARCPFCWIHANNIKSPELSDERWLDLADEICQLGVQGINIASSGGEPFVRGQLLMQILGKFSKADIRGNLITNGTLLTDHFARELVELQWLTLQVSIHAPTARIHDEHMGLRGAFRRAMRGIEDLNRWKKRLGSNAPELHFRMVLTGKNFIHLLAYIRFANSKGASKVCVRKIIKVVPHLDDSFLIPKNKEKEFGSVLRKAKQVAEEIGIDIEFEFDTEPYFHARKPEKQGCPEKGSNNKCGNQDCPVPFSELVIFGNGAVGPCANFVGWQFKKAEDRKGIVEDASAASLGKVWRAGFSRIWSNSIEKTTRDFPCRRCSVEMEMHTLKSQWPDSFFHQRFGHLRKHEKYEEGIRFGLEHLKQYPDNQTLTRYIEEFRKKLENKERESAEQLAQLFHDKFNNLRKQGKYEEGIQFGLKQLKEHRDSAVLHHHIGEFHMELEEHDKAIGHLSKAAQLDPKMEWTRFSLGKCLYLGGRYKESEEEFKANLKLTSNRLSHYHSWLFLAMAADARNDRYGCKKALKGLREFREFIGNEIPMEHEFLMRLKNERRLPRVFLDIVQRKKLLKASKSKAE